MERAIAFENTSPCPVCNKKIKNDYLIAIKVDGLWLCGSGCIDKFLKEKQKWAPKEWDKLCKMQAVCVEQKRTEIKNTRVNSVKLSSNY